MGLNIRETVTWRRTVVHVVTTYTGWMNQTYSRLSTTHGHIADSKLLVCMYWTRLVLVRPAASLYYVYWLIGLVSKIIITDVSGTLFKEKYTFS